MIEMLLSASIWLLLCSTLLPQLMVIVMERKNIETLHTGNQLLSEILQTSFHETTFDIEDEVIRKDGIDYVVTKNFNGEIQKWEICLSWEDRLSKKFTRCGYMNE